MEFICYVDIFWEMADRLTRIAIVSSDRCKPKKCRQECKKSCPVVKTGASFSYSKNWIGCLSLLIAYAS